MLEAKLSKIADVKEAEHERDLLDSNGSQELSDLSISEPETDSRDSGQDDNPQVESEMRALSFGALAEAQAAIQAQEEGRRGQVRNSSADKLQALRNRLTEVRGLKTPKSASIGTEKSSRAVNSSSTSSSLHRLSKHAPQELSSKRAVTRKRAAVEISKNPTHVRDPRFSSAQGHIDEEKVRKNYSFLDDYRKNELAELKAATKKTKNAEEREQLKMEQLRMESRQKQQAIRDLEKNVLQEHRRKERGLVKEGKKPFYLKKSEQKRQALVARYEGMKGKDREKAIDRRRKKASQRERRNMPTQRRLPANDI